MKNFSIDTGAGNDKIYSNDDYSAVQVDAGAGDDYIVVGQNGTNAEWLFNTVPGGSGAWGAGNTKFKFFGAKIVLEYQNIKVVQEIETDSNYVTTAAEINQAIKDAIDNNFELSKVLKYSDIRNNGLLVESTIDRAGQDLDIQFLAPKYSEEIAGDDDWTTGNYTGDSAEDFAERDTVSDSDMANAWSVWYPDSTGIGDGSGTGVYLGVNDEDDVFQAMFDDLDYLATTVHLAPSAVWITPTPVRYRTPPTAPN